MRQNTFRRSPRSVAAVTASSVLLSALAVGGVVAGGPAGAAASPAAVHAARTTTVPALPALGFFANQVPVNAAGQMVAPTSGTQPTPAGYATGSAADDAVIGYTASVADTPNWHPAVLNGFFDWQDNATETADFFGTYEPPVPGTTETPAQFVYYAVNTAHAVPLLTWQPDIMTSTASSGKTNPACENDPDTTTALAEIDSGDCDQFISSFAAALAATGQTVYLRFAHEMNAGTYPWGCGYDRADPSSPLGCTTSDSTATAYVRAFRHVWSLFQQAGAGNVEFVWCVNSSGPGAAVPVTSFFPGDRYVSWTAIDGYNRDSADPSVDNPLYSIFSYDYGQLTQVSTRPVMISEVNTWDTVSDLPPSGGPFGTIQSTTSTSFSKSSWITNGLESAIPQKLPRVRAVLFFDALGNGFSYPFTSSPAALGAWVSVVNSGDYSEAAPTGTLVYCSPESTMPVPVGTCATATTTSLVSAHVSGSALESGSVSPAYGEPVRR